MRGVNQLALDYRCTRNRVHKHAADRCPHGLTESVCVYCERVIYRSNPSSSQWGTMPEYDFVMADPHLEVPIA